MTRTLTIMLGAILVAIGATFTLQGLNVLKGSGMSDQTQWAVVGPVVAIVGLVMVVFGFRRMSQPPR